MSNTDFQATWHYHNGTKHPGGELLTYEHEYNPAARPLLFKEYRDIQSIPLPLDTAPEGMPALEGISANPQPSGEERLPDLATLARILYFSAGITKTLKRPLGEIAFRAAACTGALYHTELYVVCSDLPGLDAGVYHFDPTGPALGQLRSGKYRRVLVEATANEPHVAHAPLILVYTDVYARNAYKYSAREYRHAFWDSGTILANTLAMSAAHRLSTRLITGFVDREVNDLVDLDTQDEFALALLPVGYSEDVPAGTIPKVEPLALETVPPLPFDLRIPAIVEMHEASSLTEPETVEEWRANALSLPLPPPSGRLGPLEPFTEEAMAEDPIEEVIVRRGSTREFAREPISFRQLSTLLQQSMQGMDADFLAEPGDALNHLYLIVNAVDGLPSGAYVYHPERQALELLREGEFRREAGYLALGQDLGADASVDIYFLTDLEAVLRSLGNRGYRAAQFDASIRAGKMYLAAYAQGFGATGLTFYDDAVTDFFAPHAAGKSGMFLIALGKRATRGGS